MSKYTKQLFFMSVLTLMFSSINVSADSIHSVLKEKNVFGHAQKKSNGRINNIYMWGIKDYVQKQREDVERKNSTKSESIAVIHKSMPTDWRRILGDPVKL